MALTLRDCTFFGPALPEPFVLNNLEGKLNDLRLLPRNVGDEGRALQQAWEVFRRKLRDLGEHGGDRRVFSHVLEPLASQLGYVTLAPQESVITREGAEDGGSLFLTPEGKKLRVWAAALGTDLDAPNRRGRAYRFSASRVAQRVLLASGERAGLLTDGEELRLLICDPARPDSHIAVDLGRSGGWRSARNVPDSYRVIRALASPGGVAALPDLVDAARLVQSQVTKKLRLQARAAIEGFLQEVLDHPGNQNALREAGASEALARQLWREGLILVYRLLFVFKLESSADPARAFSFAATSLWRNTYSPNTALADIVRKVLDDSADSGGFLEGALRALWQMFAGGMSSSELEIKALGGMLFGEGATPLLDRLGWGERAVARLLDALLWTPVEGRAERERVHYGALDVEDLGRVYEALLELEPGISTEPMCRLRRAKLEVVVPAAQGTPYRASAANAGAHAEVDEDEGSEDEGGDEDAEEAEAPRRRASAGRTQVVFIEDIPANRFFLRVGLGRKATGSYYTPHPFVRFLVQETLGPQLLERSPKEDPQPGRILELKVIDPAMGSGHFLVEACRYLGEAMYEACRLCDELAVQAEEQAEKVKDSEQATLLARAAELRKRVEDLPDPEDELVAYLPSRVPEGEDSGLSQKKAEALCRRLVAVHCLYGVDKNPLAVELAKLSLWLESYAEGLPLTFMDHRLVCGDSLTGPFFEHLLTYPGSGNKLDDLYTQGLTDQLRATLADALTYVRDLEASVGKDVADLEQKWVAKEKLDAALKPLKLLAAAWSGGVMLGEGCDDAAYLVLANAIADSGNTEAVLAAQPRLRNMVEAGREGVSFELAFPEVFHHSDESRGGFDAVLGNPPWEAIRRADDQFFSGIDLRALTGATKREKKLVHKQLLADPSVSTRYAEYVATFHAQDRASDRLFSVHKAQVRGNLAGRGTYDAYMLFAEIGARLLGSLGALGLVLPSAFHANEGATGVRRMYLEQMALCCCFSFENRKKLFDIHSSFKFAAVVAKSASGGTDEFECGFYWHDLARLFEADGRLRYSAEFVRRTGDDYLTFLELRTGADRDAAAALYGSCVPFGTAAANRRMRLSQEVNMTYEVERFTPTNTILGSGEDPRRPDVAEALRERRFLPLHEGKTFHQFDDAWGERPRYVVAISAMSDKPGWLRAAHHYRLAFRDIASSTNERTGIFCLVPPGVVLGNTAPCEREPHERPTSHALCLEAVANTYPLDWTIRLKAASHVNLFILNGCPFPSLNPVQERFLAHASLRLSCNHVGYAPLWKEQVSDAWHEIKPSQNWPVLEGDDARWSVRAAIDAVVAEAYGLDRDQYSHVLSTFSHRSYPKAPELCLATFDELKAIGLEAFTQKHDPYWDIPLNESLPQPVIDLLPSMASQNRSEPTVADEDFGPLFNPADKHGIPAAPQVPKLVPSQPNIPAWLTKTPTDRQVLLLSRVVDLHQQAHRLESLGNVKAEKITYLLEAHVGIDLERAAIREAAGPADFPRLQKAIHRGQMLHAFSVRTPPSHRGGQWSADSGLGKRVREYEQCFGQKQTEIDALIRLLAPMDSEQAEIVATLYACWSDLLACGAEPSDDGIFSDFYNWSEGKKKYECGRLQKALAWMRDHQLNPSGTAKVTAIRKLPPSKVSTKATKAKADSEGHFTLILQRLEEQGVITSGDAQEATGLDAAGVRPLLRRLVDEGLAETEGQRRGMRYRRRGGG